jgi:hypothetical protein
MRGKAGVVAGVNAPISVEIIPLMELPLRAWTSHAPAMKPK